MCVYAIISEFNPFHNGHKYIIDEAKARGAEAVVCVMSGNSVQRGELAIADKYYRAEMALRCGADLVVELGFPWCSSGAEAFARSGIYIAKEFADTLIFGSECGDTEILTRAADICLERSFIDEYKNTVRENVGSAEAYFKLLEAKTERKYSSNDILGIEYIKAAKRFGAELSFETVCRRGAGYLSSDIKEGEFQSATAIRKAISVGGLERIEAYLPRESAEILKRAEENGDISDIPSLEKSLRMFFRLTNMKELTEIADIDEGLASRICRAAREEPSCELINSVRTKRYTDSRIRRAILFSLVGVKNEDVEALPEYVNLLAANSVGCKLLAEKRGKTPFALLSKAADFPESPFAKRQAELSKRLDAVFTLSLKKERAVADILKKSPIIL